MVNVSPHRVAVTADDADAVDIDVVALVAVAVDRNIWYSQKQLLTAGVASQEIKKEL